MGGNTGGGLGGGDLRVGGSTRGLMSALNVGARACGSAVEPTSSLAREPDASHVLNANGILKMSLIASRRVPLTVVTGSIIAWCLVACKPQANTVPVPANPPPTNGASTVTPAPSSTPRGPNADPGQGLPARPPGRSASEVPDVPGAGVSGSTPGSNGQPAVPAGSGAERSPGAGTAGGLAFISNPPDVPPPGRP